MTKRTVIIGVGGPVGSGKTLLLERLQKKMPFSWLKIQA